MLPSDANLDQEMLAAHRARDLKALVGLYETAADQRESQGDVEAACFYLVHAYVFALDCGLERAANIHGRLKAHGREE